MTKNIKICFVMLKAYPLFNPKITSVFGGAEVDVYLLAKELAKDKRFEVSCIVADYGQKQIETFDNVTIIKSLDFTKTPLSYPNKLWQAMKLADANIYFREMSSLVAFTVALFCKVKNRKLVIRTANTGECDGSYIKKNLVRGRAFKWTLKNSHAVFVQNKKGNEAIEKLKISPIALGNAHHITNVSADSKNTILWVGRSAEVKRATLFLELAKQFPEKHFTMICQKGSYDKNYDELIKQANSIANLTFLKRVEFSKIGEHFARAKMLVNTSDTEGFPNTFIQACINSAPILSLNVNPDNFLYEQKCGYCADGDWNKFTDLLEKLDKTETLKELGKNARDYALENHDITKLIEIYKDTFINLNSTVESA